MDPACSDRLSPLDSPEVPLGECDRIGPDDEVLVESRVDPTHFRRVPTNYHPEPVPLDRLVAKVETYNSSSVRESINGEILGTPCVENERRVTLLGCDIQPSFSPVPHRFQNSSEVSTRRCERVPRSCSS